MTMNVPIVSKSIVRMNAEKDPNYCPYCMRCTGLVRMEKIDAFLWGCNCGAIGDERDDVECPSCKGTKINAGASCLCCEGAGTITQFKADSLTGIRRDLKRRTFKRGWKGWRLNG